MSVSMVNQRILAHARQDGSYLAFLRVLKKTEVLILNDWIRDPISLSAA